MTPKALRALALIGATVRMQAIANELAAIRNAFPELRAILMSEPKAKRPKVPNPIVPKAATRTHKPMSLAQRRAVGRRMRRYWAERRKANHASK